jgi:hypothetical protein
MKNNKRDEYLIVVSTVTAAIMGNLGNKLLASEIRMNIPQPLKLILEILLGIFLTISVTVIVLKVVKNFTQMILGKSF